MSAERASTAALVPLILCLIGCGGSQPPSRIAPEQTAEHLGREITVCGNVVQAVYEFGTRGRPTLLYLGSASPDPVMTVVIWGRDRHRFDPPPDVLYRDRRICVTGVIRRFQNRPQIVVRWPNEIALDDDVVFPEMGW